MHVLCLSIFQHHKYKRKKLKATAMAKVGDLETCINNRIKEIEEEEERNLKILKELETQIMSPTEKGTQHPSTSTNEPILGDDVPKASDVAPEGGPSSRPTGKGNMEPSDDDDEKKTNEGKSSKSGGVDDA